jgi:hypothetical protein
MTLPNSRIATVKSFAEEISVEKKLLLGSLVGIALILSAIYLMVSSKLGDESINQHATIQRLKELQIGLEAYKTECGAYPIALAELVENSKCENFKSLDILAIKDAWGNEFIYFPIVDGYEVRSMGEEWIAALPSQKPNVVRRSR